MLRKKMKLTVMLMLVAALFMSLATVTFAASYELTRVNLYDYYDEDNCIKIGTDDIESTMEKTVDWRRVLIVPSCSKGTIKISGSDVEENSKGFYVALEEGDSTRVTIAIYNSDGQRQKRYYLDLTRGTTELEKVVFTGNDYDKTITDIKEENELLIPMSESELRLKVYTSNDDYTVECNGSTSKKNTWDISIPKNKTVTVEIVLYNDNDKEVATYEFDITRSTKAEESSSKLDLLDSLKVEADDISYELFPKFSNETSEYFVCFPRDVKSAVIIPTLGDDGDSVKVNNKTVSSGRSSRDLDVTTGGSAYTVRVTDEDGDTHDFTVTLIRASNSKGSNASIERLKVKRGFSKSDLSEVDLSPEFEEYTTKYTLTAGAESAYFSFRAQLNDSDCLALLSDGNSVMMLEDSSYSSVLELEGDSEAQIRVYSPSYENYKTYYFDVEGRALDNNAYLEDLDLYVDGVKVKLSPEFDTKTYAYTVTVGKNADVFKVTATAEESSSTITVMGDEVKSGKASDEYSLNAAFTNIPVVVTAEDGSANTYRLTVSRSATSTDNSNTNNTNTNNNTNNKIELNKDLRVVLRVGSMTYIENGKTKTLAAAPYITSSRTQVPLRVIAEALGAGVNYNPVAKQITINLGDERLYMDIGRTIKDFDVAPEVRANTTFVPVRYVSEKLGCKCTYNNASKEVVITVATDE